MYRGLNLHPKPTWASLVKGNQLTAKGNPLSFIPPTISKGQLVEILDKVDIDKIAEIWDSSIVMYVVGDMLLLELLLGILRKNGNKFLSLNFSFMMKDIL